MICLLTKIFFDLLSIFVAFFNTRNKIGSRVGILKISILYNFVIFPIENLINRTNRLRCKSIPNWIPVNWKIILDFILQLVDLRRLNNLVLLKMIYTNHTADWLVCRTILNWIPFKWHIFNRLIYQVRKRGHCL